MGTISIVEDIVPVAQFKAHAYGVLVLPSEYDRLTYTNRFLVSVREGMDDIEAGRFYTTEELLK